MSDFSGRAVNVLVVLATVGAIGSITWRAVSVFRKPIDSFPSRQIDDWVRFSSFGHRIGPDSVPVTIVEFTDFECPFCAQAARDLDVLLTAYAGEIAVVYRHFPIVDIHPHARAAAIAAECAAMQGKFREYSSLLFTQQDQIGKKDWRAFAAEAQLADADEFHTCLIGEDAADRLSEDSVAADRLAIRGTPTFLVNERLIEGHPGADELENIVLDALREARR